MKQAFIYLLTLAFVGLNMVMSGQKPLDYFTLDLLLCSLLASVGYVVLLTRVEIAILGKLLLRKKLLGSELQTGLNSLQNGWRFLAMLMSAFVLLQSVNALVHAADKQAMQFLGTWLATLLLGGLYLLILRWGFFLPLINSLKRRQILQSNH